MRKITYDPLWKTLVDRQMGKSELAERASISKNTVTKLAKGEHVMTEVLEKICNALDCEIYDVVEMKHETPDIKSS